jgi:hypothetical protein
MRCTSRRPVTLRTSKSALTTTVRISGTIFVDKTPFLLFFRIDSLFVHDQ